MKNSEEQQQKKEIKSNSQFIETLNQLEEAIDDLRIMVKYQTFDLEVTRRENEYLRQLLENRGHPQY